MAFMPRYNLKGGWDLSNEFTIKTPWYRKAALWFVQTVALALAMGSCYAFSANGGCGAGKRGREAVRSSGFLDIQLGSTAWYRCPKHAVFGSYFTAVNVQGRKVDGYVCCGVIIGCSVKF